MKNLVIISFILSTLTVNSQEIDLSTHGKKLQRGIYKTFDDFKSGVPSITDSFYVESKPRNTKNWEGTNSLTPRYANTNKKIKKVWGFCDGNQVYVFHQSEFFPIEIQDDQLSFFGYGIIDYSGVGVAGVLGGAIGGGIYGAAAIAKAKNQKIKYVIDSTTGKIHNPLNLTKENVGTKTAKLILYRRGQKELDTPVNFSINDSIVYSFIPNSFLELRFKMSNEPIKICYNNEHEECINVILNSDKPKYIKCSLSTKDNTPRLIEVRTSKGEFESVTPEKQQKKRDKEQNGNKK